MGVCFGKEEQKPVKREDRKRIGETPQSPMPARGPKGKAARAQQISARNPGSSQDEEAAFLGTSMTDRRQEEYEQIRTIIESTTHNFIDVSQKPSVLDQKDVLERRRNYEEQLNKANAQMKPSLLFVLPEAFHASATAQDLVPFLLESKVSSEDQELINTISQDVAVAMEDFTVTDVPNFVVHLEQIAV